MKQTIKKIYSKDGTQIAYSKLGNGPPLVKTATYITHLEEDWNNPVWRPFLNELSRYCSLIRYDERGCGLSDWYARDYSWETWVEDLKAVVDAEKLDKFILYGQSQGSTVAVAFAARYPERVEKLFILGGYARGWLHRNLNEIEKQEEQLLIDMMKIGWANDNPAFRNFFSSQLMPDASADQIKAFNQMMRISTEPEIAAKLERQMHLANVSDEAPNIKCPTIIFHSYGDATIPFKEGKILADLIPNARFVRLDSGNHIIQDNEPAWTVFWNEVYQFIEVEDDYSEAIQYKTPSVNRVLRAILFTDIVESTKLALELGDEKWINMLEKHNDIFQLSTKRFNGEIIKDTGDGFLIVFESTTSAIDCAKDLIYILGKSNIDIRCGLHTGEIEQMRGDIRGINVHIAARIMSAAGINEIWTTSIVEELTLGSSLKFEPQGEYQLKGISQKKTLYKII
jgi:pimeloyl-ACP methyl ester carboxylesterase/class 3 adenylate cyclase